MPFLPSLPEANSVRSSARRMLVCFAIFGTPASTAMLPSKPESTLELAVQSDHNGDVAALAFSPDGRLLATADDDGRLKVWEVPTGRVVRTILAPHDIVASIAVGSRGVLTSLGTNTGVHSYRIRDGSVIDSLALDPSILPDAEALSRDGSELAVSGTHDDLPFAMWRRIGSTHSRRLHLHLADSATHLAISRNGTSVLIGSADSNVTLWRPERRDSIATIAGLGPARAVGISDDGGILGVLRTDGRAIAFDAKTRKRIHVPVSNSDTATCFTVSPNGRLIFVAGFRGRIAPASSNEPETTVGDFAQKYTVAAFSCNNGIIAAAGVAEIGEASRRVFLISAASGHKIRALSGSSIGVSGVAVSAGRIASSHADSSVWLWSLSTDIAERTMRVRTDRSDLTLSRSGDLLAGAYPGCDGNGGVDVWDLRIAAHPEAAVANVPVRTVRFSADGAALAGGLGDGSVRVWSMPSRNEIFSVRPVGGKVAASISWSPDGRLIATGWYDGRIRVWDTSTQALQSTLGRTEPHSNFTVFALSFSPDGKRLAAGGVNDSQIRIWDHESGAVAARIDRTPQGAVALVFRIATRVIVAEERGALYGRVVEWQIDSTLAGRILATHELGPSSIAFDSAAGVVVSGGWDGVLHIVGLGSGALRASIIAVGGRSTTTGSRASPGTADYFTITPAGYFRATPHAEDVVLLRSGERLYPARCFHSQFFRPDLVALALSGRVVLGPRSILIPNEHC